MDFIVEIINGFRDNYNIYINVPSNSNEFKSYEKINALQINPNCFFLLLLDFYLLIVYYFITTKKTHAHNLQTNKEITFFS